MKRKLLYLLAMVFVMSFSSCSDDEDDVIVHQL